MVSFGVQILSGDLNVENKHRHLRKIHRIEVHFVNHSNEDKDALLGCNFDQLVGIACQKGAVGENGKRRVLVVAEELNQGFIILILRYFHQNSF